MQPATTQFALMSAALVPANVSQSVANAQWSGLSIAAVAKTDASFVSVAIGALGKSSVVSFTNFGFVDSPEIVINGVTATLVRTGTGVCFDGDVYLENGGAKLANAQNLSSGTAWPVSPETLQFGGTTSTWGAVLTPTIVSQATFGFALSVANRGSASVCSAAINSVLLRVKYRFEVTLAMIAPAWSQTNDGGESVTITGTGFRASDAKLGVALVVQFGTANATIVAVTATTIVVTTPARTVARSVPVRVSFDNGTTFATASLMFQYESTAPPMTPMGNDTTLFVTLSAAPVDGVLIGGLVGLLLTLLLIATLIVVIVLGRGRCRERTNDAPVRLPAVSPPSGNYGNIGAVFFEFRGTRHTASLH